MKTEQAVLECLIRFRDEFKGRADQRRAEDGDVLLGMRQMYDALGDEQYVSVIQKYLQDFLEEDGKLRSDAFNIADVNCSKLLFFLYDKTGDEKYRTAIVAVMEKLREDPKLLSPDPVSVEALYMVQPFYMEYETRYDKKAKYSDILRQFERPEILSNTGDAAGRQRGLYLTALIDTLSGMSFEIYEKYRKLQDEFKRVHRELYQSGEKGKGICCGDGADDAENLRIAYAVMKACRMGVLLKEKYASDGMGIVERLVENRLTDILEDSRTAGPFLCAYGQYLQLKGEFTA